MTETSHPIFELLEVMARLRDPEQGCPWDRQQNFATIAPYTLEEAYEVADAIERNNMEELCDELGDLLFQVVFHAQMAAEQGSFDFRDVCQAIVDKMVRRHPHVFADTVFADEEEQHRAWEQQKHRERQAKTGTPAGSVMDGISLNLPALVRAMKLQKRAARTGLDWPDATGVLDKLDEELQEFRQAHADGEQQAMTEELGDLLFTCANLARHEDIDAEAALRHANNKFDQRVRCVEQRAQEQGIDPASLNADALDALWQQCK